MSTVVNIAFVVNGQPAGSGVFTPAAAPLVAPVPAGTLLGTIADLRRPIGFGSFTPSGPDAAARGDRRSRDPWRLQCECRSGLDRGADVLG